MAIASTQPQTNTLQLRRTIRAPRAKVFRAWTDPQALKQWFGPPGYPAQAAEVDLRIGGKYRITMRKDPDGDLKSHYGTFQEIRPSERLVFTWNYDHRDIGNTLVTIDFRDLGDQTEIVLTHERFPSPEVRDQHSIGWNGCLDRLEQFVQ